MYRSESQIFTELSKLCSSKGYAHVIAFLCFRDNTIRYKEELSGDDLNHQYFSTERLLRIEISTLIGLMLKKPIDYSLPTPSGLQEMIDKTDSILHELHQEIAKPFTEELEKKISTGSSENPFKKGRVIRESIFYSGESAHIFQYRDFAPIKYSMDNDWLKKEMGFSVEEAHSIVSSILKVLNRKLAHILNQFIDIKPDKWTYLPAYVFTLEEIVKISEVESEKVKRVISAFTFREGSVNASFQSASDFNEFNATPLIRVDENKYILFQQYSLMESFYESPYFWMLDDKEYKDTSLLNRGEFTENFAVNCLSRVFQSNSVYKNVEIYDRKKNKMGEIDVLVVFGDRAIVVQAKSKKLTIEARKGNEANLHSDFKAGIQDAYYQGYSCSELLQNREYILKNESGELQLERSFKKIFNFCVVSDHYPALTFQSFQNLEYSVTEKIPPPFVMDIFHLDVMTEMLHTPLYFLSYIEKRVRYAKKLVASNEGTILAFHLKNNLWIDQDTDYVYLEDDFGADLDATMLARRESLPGKTVIDGIQTKYKKTPFEKLILQIENNDSPILINLGLFLLEFGEETINKFNQWFSNSTTAYEKDGKNHDFTLAVGDSGITVHCNRDPLRKFEPRLNVHSVGRKYLLKNDKWFGICVDPFDYTIRYVLELNDPWEESEDTERLIETFSFKS